MTDERRQGDLLIMDKLAAIQEKQSDMHTELALNTQATKQGTEQITRLNGKVAAHESRLQAIESNQALISNNLAQVNQSNIVRNNQYTGWRDWAVKGVIAVIVMLFYYLLTKNGFPNFLN
jgi:hypothetical protein